MIPWRRKIMVGKEDNREGKIYRRNEKEKEGSLGKDMAPPTKI